MPHLGITLLLSLVPAAWSGAPTESWPKDVEFDRIDGSVVHLKAPEGASAPKPVDTKLFDLKHLGRINAIDGSAPYLVFSARPCQGCEQDQHVYLIRMDGQRSTHFVYPGKILDPKSRATVLQSWAYFGKCLSDTREAYVEFRDERVDRRRGLQSSVFIAEPAKDHLEEQMKEGRRRPKRQTVENRSKRKGSSCIRIEGRNRMMSAKALDLRPRHDIGDDETEEDEPTKENQTDQELKQPEAEAD